jgi:protein-disulfide isomerase
VGVTSVPAMCVRCVSLIGAAVLVACLGCERTDAPEPAPAPQAGTAGEQPEAVKDREPAAERATERAPAPTPAVALADVLALEHKPGATPAIAQVEVPPGPPHPDLVGAPGPSPAMGPDTAPVKVFVFSDFQCPVCKRVVEPLKQISRVYPDDVQIIFKHHALSTHRLARDAATAAIAAYRQGKFWEYHDKLFQNQTALEVVDLHRYAEDLGLDMTRFRQDMQDAAAVDQIAYEGEIADRLGLPGTPGFLVNGKPLAGWGSYYGFKSMIDQALADAEALPGEGVAQAEVAKVATARAGDEGRQLAEFVWGEQD